MARTVIGLVAAIAYIASFFLLVAVGRNVELNETLKLTVSLAYWFAPLLILIAVYGSSSDSAPRRPPESRLARVDQRGMEILATGLWVLAAVSLFAGNGIAFNVFLWIGGLLASIGIARRRSGR